MRIIGHLDMDAFFASVEERDNLRFKNLPIVVGADPENGKGRGVVSTANYKAREYGIRSAIPISIAWQLSEKAKILGKPGVIFLSGNFEKYEKASKNIISILKKHTSFIEEAGIDEAYFDLSFAGDYEDAISICKKIKQEIKKEERLTCSIGIGPNKLVAKIASDMEKPDGLTPIKEKDAEKIFESFLIRKIPGIGPKTEEKFLKIGIKTVRDLKKFTREELKKLLGKWGIDLYSKIRGIDDSPISKESEVKSIGEQETFRYDTRDLNFISERLIALCADVLGRSKKDGFNQFKTIVLTIRFFDFETKSKTYTMDKPISDLKTLNFESLKLLLSVLNKQENPKNKSVRLIGIRIEKFLKKF